MSVSAGEAHWAIVPYTPEAPFQIYVTDGDPVEVPSAEQIIDGLSGGGDAEFNFLVRAKARPILLLSDLHDPRTGDLFGLRLLRLSELSAPEREQVTEQREPQLFHLREDRFPGLPEPSAAMISAPIRVHHSAIDSRGALGSLDRNELRVLSERFVTYWRLDLHQLLLRTIQEMARRRGGG